jgi:Tol biopolymer transport system component
VLGRSPRWSPQGDRLAYIDALDLLHVVRPDGTGDALVAGGRTAQPGLGWSPDGRWIVYVGQSGLALVEVESGMVLPLALRGPGGTNLEQPAWRP